MVSCGLFLYRPAYDSECVGCSPTVIADRTATLSVTSVIRAVIGTAIPRYSTGSSRLSRLNETAGQHGSKSPPCWVRVPSSRGYSRTGYTSGRNTSWTAESDSQRAIFIFFDPDNGLGIGSRPRGRRNSCKHIYWDEVQNAFQSGASLLIYQHFIREARLDYTARLARELRSRTGAPAVVSFSTPHVLFLLASQSRHLRAFQERLATIESVWEDQIAVCNHQPPDY